MAWNNYFNPMQTYAPQMSVQAPQSVPVGGMGLSPSSRMLSNRDEANAVPADFTGALMVFPDMRNNRVYIKRWNFQTGTADFVEFVPFAQESKEEPKYATLEDLNALRNEFFKYQKAVKNDDADE